MPQLRLSTAKYLSVYIYLYIQIDRQMYIFKKIEQRRNQLLVVLRKRKKQRQEVYLPWRFLQTLFKKPKHKYSEKTKSNQASKVQSVQTHERRQEICPRETRSFLKPKVLRRETKTLHWNRKSVGSFPEVEEAGMDDEFQQPTMSHESHLSYDQPQKKNKDCENFSHSNWREKTYKE